MRIRWRRSQTLFVLIALLGIVTYFHPLAAHALGTPVREAFTRLATQPSVMSAFADSFGRQDALVFLIWSLLLAPLALIVIVVVGFFGVAVLGGVLVPFGRMFRLPDWATTLLVLGGLGALAWAKSDAWLPGGLWLLGLVARASRIVLT